MKSISVEVDNWYAKATEALAQRSKPIEQIVKEHNDDTELDTTTDGEFPAPRRRRLREVLATDVESKIACTHLDW
jgi:hypothetical protein